jgi:CRP-like cAMP-binding protein
LGAATGVAETKIKGEVMKIKLLLCTMHDVDFSTLLQHIRRFIELNDDEAAFFTSLLRYKKLRKRQFLVQAGEVHRFESYVLRGCLRAFFTHRDGQEHITQFAVEDWWIADDSSYLLGEPAMLDVEALEDCVLLQLHFDDRERLFRQIPKFERFFRIAFERSFLAQQRRILNNLSMSAEERYLDFLERYPLIAQRVPQYHIAAYLGVSAEFLSKIRSGLAKN